MKDITFDLQIRLGLIIALLGFILAIILQNAIAINIGGVFYGMIFVLNPIAPDNFIRYKNTSRIVRLIGIVIVILSLIIKINI